MSTNDVSLIPVTPFVEAFFHKPTNTISYVVVDQRNLRCAIIDPVLDYDPARGKTSTESAERIVKYVKDCGLEVDWILETHAHADHLSAAPFLKAELGGLTAIGERIGEVQKVFAALFNAEASCKTDGSQFDRQLADGDSFQIGTMEVTVLHTPGHTPACVSYLVGDAVFVGDTLFMPDYGTARTDFPGGDAATLYDSIARLLALPADTRMYLCHDYLPASRENYCWQTSVAEQLQHNVHVGLHNGLEGGLQSDMGKAWFVAMRKARDKGLPPPKLLLPSVQVNIRAGEWPPAEANGTHYLKIPLNRL